MKKILLLVVMAVLVAGMASAEGTKCTPKANMVNQDPYPASPGEYVKVVFQLTDVEGADCANGAWFRLMPRYPFSLDENDNLRTIASNTFLPSYNTNWMIPYNLRVDKDALDGEYIIEAHYGSDAAQANSASYMTKTFNLSLDDSRTLFDAVIQEVTGQEVTIAIANAGEHTANSVIVRVPEQESFRVTGTNGQMVGNMESGDYSVVGFTISPKGAGRFQNQSARNPQEMQGAQAQAEGSPTGMQSTPDLKFDIAYTDSLGVRRTVNMALPLEMRGNSSMLQATGNFAGMRTPPNSAAPGLSLSWWQISISAVAGIIFALIAMKAISQRRKSSKGHEDVPDWIKEKDGKK